MKTIHFYNKTPILPKLRTHSELLKDALLQNMKKLFTISNHFYIMINCFCFFFFLKKSYIYDHDFTRYNLTHESMLIIIIIHI